MKKLLILSLFLIWGCDFSSQSHQKILEAQNLLNQSKYNEAVKTYEEIVDKIPPSELKFKLLFQIGEIYSLYLSNPEKARFYFDQIIKNTKDPNWKVNSMERIADLEYSEFENFQRSSDLYERLYDFYPHLARRDFYEFRLARSLMEIGNLEKSEKMFLNISKNPSHEFSSRSFYFLGTIEFRKKDWRKAGDFLLDYLRRETNKDHVIQAKYLLANTYETLEELDKAYNIYYSLLGEYPNPQVIRNRLRSIYTRKVDRKR